MRWRKGKTFLVCLLGGTDTNDVEPGLTDRIRSLRGLWRLHWDIKINRKLQQDRGLTPTDTNDVERYREALSPEGIDTLPDYVDDSEDEESRRNLLRNRALPCSPPNISSLRSSFTISLARGSLSTSPIAVSVVYTNGIFTVDSTVTSFVMRSPGEIFCGTGRCFSWA